MKVLDLFSGLGGFSQAFKDRGHKTVTVDWLEKFNPTIVIDIRNLQIQDLKRFGKFDVILASPPCETFSLMSINKHWKNRKPSKEAKEQIRLVAHTINLILSLYPRFWFLENPRGMMVNVLGKPQATITQCQYGRRFMKPTYFWGVFPKGFKPKRCYRGQDCHTKAPRGSRTGIQGFMTREEKAKIPYNLSLAICKACEKETAPRIKGD